MAKKKATSDRHSSGFLVRLPETHRGPLDRLKRDHRRAYTVIVQLALEDYYRKHGVPFPSRGETPE